MIPWPRDRAVRTGSQVLRPGLLPAEPELESVADWLRTVLPGAGGVALRLDPALPREGYTLDVSGDGVVITGGAAAGVFYGAQTVRQQLPPASLRRARISDEPLTLTQQRVRDGPRVAWRGVLLDVARHGLPVGAYRVAPHVSVVPRLRVTVFPSLPLDSGRAPRMLMSRPEIAVRWAF